MPKKIALIFTVTALFLLYSINLKAQSKLTAALNKHLIEIKTLDPDADFTDLDSLKPYLAGKQVFGIGEATHGTHEFFQYKHRMLEFLVKEMGVKAFVIEGDFSGSQFMNDYVIEGKGTVKGGLSGIGFGVWMTQEVVDMCNWLKNYNATQTDQNKVRFFGCDMQWASASLSKLKDYLQPQGRFTPEMESALVVSKKPLSEIQVSDSDKMMLRTAADQLAKITFTIGDTALTHHYAREVEQYVEFLESKSKMFPARQFEFRDKCMAENCEWVYNYIGQQKMMIWAHNAHIQKSGGSMKVATMGQGLSNYLGDKYYAMGFDFYQGSMRSFNMAVMKYETPQMPPSEKGSSGAEFAKCRLPNFIIDLKSTAAAEPEAADFFNKKVPSISQGPAFSPKTGLFYNAHKLAETYDAVIFFRQTTAAITMKSILN